MPVSSNRSLPPALAAELSQACARGKPTVLARLAKRASSTVPVSRTSNHESLNTGRCKGEAYLNAISGLVLVPFGGGLERCAVGESCGFAVADCGGGGGAALRGLFLRARFVGPAIFMPHLSLVRAAGNQLVLLAQYCPPAAGSYQLDARVLWWLPRAGAHPSAATAPRRLAQTNDSCAFSCKSACRDPALREPPACASVRCGANCHMTCCTHATRRPPTSSQASSDRLGATGTLDTLDEVGREFLGGRVGVGTDAKHHRQFTRCEHMSGLHVPVGPLVVAEAPKSPARPPRTARLPPCTASSGAAGHWRRLPAADERVIFRGAPSQLGEEGGMWTDAHWGPFMGPEEERHSRWAWASRTCAHTYFTPAAAQRCAARAGRTRLLLHGDSQSRALYISTARWLGLPVLDEGEMKRRTNHLQIREHSIASAPSRQHGGGGGGASAAEGISLVQSYTWGMGARELNASLLEVIRRVRPHVVVTNFAASHTLPAQDGITSSAALPRHFARWFRAVLAPQLGDAAPSLWLYQRMGALQGMRRADFVEETFRAYDEAIWEALRPLGFGQLATRLPELHRFDVKAPDGWHLLMNSTTSMLTANLLFERLCIDVLES